MIDEEKRKAVLFLYQNGMNISDLSRNLKLNRKTVKKIIAEQDNPPKIKVRKDKINIDDELIRKLFTDNEGWGEKVHEELKARGIEIAYSTLTERLRKLGLRDKHKERSYQIPDSPGQEFQHDTSPYVLRIGGISTKVHCSLIYYRYSKVRYLKFYRFFNRFKMKCFFHEALTHFGYTPKTVIIDNTNLAVLRGTGANAIFVPEMIEFSRQYGFEWKAHMIKHANRKAGVERSFWSVETNFFPNRQFTSIEDLNQQAFFWAQKRNKNPNKKTKIIPIEAFEIERPEMIAVPKGLPAPYLIHERGIDQYGFLAFNGNYYWIPKGTRGTVMVLEYSGNIKIYQNRKILIEYALPDEAMKGKKFIPDGVDLSYKPQKKTISCSEEQNRLQNLGEEVSSFVTEVIKKSTPPKVRYRWIREMYIFSQRLPLSLLLKTLQRARKYGVWEVKVLEKIALLISRNEETPDLLVDINHGFEERESYLEGELADAPNLDRFDKKYNMEDSNE